MLMNRLQLTALLLNEITFLKFGQDLAPNAKGFRKAFKEAFGLKKNATALDVIVALGKTYKENQMEQEFWDKINKFKIADKVTVDMI